MRYSTQEHMKRLPSPRAALFALAVFAFLVLAPLAVLRATGYRVDFSQQRIVATGAIAVNVLPPGAEVTVIGDSVAKTKRTRFISPTAFFPNLLPRTYTVTVQSGGRTVWEKQVVVEEGRTTAFRSVRIFPEEPRALPFRFQAPEAIAHIAANAPGTILLGWGTEHLEAISPQDNGAPIALPYTPPAPIRTVSFLDATTILIAHEDNSWAVIQEAGTANTQAFMLPGRFNEMAALGERRVAARSDTGLFVIDWRQNLPPLIQKLEDNVAAVDTSEDQIIFLDARGVLWRSAPDGINRAQLSVEPLPEAAFTQEPPVSPAQTASAQLSGTLTATADDAIALFIDSNRTAWLFENEERKFSVIAEGATAARFSQNEKLLLLFGTHEVLLHAVQEQLEQPPRPKGSQETITRISDVIERAAFLAGEEAYTIFRADHTGYIVELDGRGGRNQVQYSEVQSFTVASARSTIYFLRSDGELTSLTAPSPTLFNRIEFY